MAILGGKGTLWGPVIGAIVFHIFKEGFWIFFLGWQYVALGVLDCRSLLFSFLKELWVGLEKNILKNLARLLMRPIEKLKWS